VIPCKLVVGGQSHGMASVLLSRQRVNLAYTYQAAVGASQSPDHGPVTVGN
jgi:hypothetical protein